MNVPMTVAINSAKDPHNVPDIFVNGPINLHNMGNHVTLTFTSVRPNGDMQLAPQMTAQPNLTAVVVSRLTLPMELAVQLKELLHNGLVPIQLPNTKQ